MNVECRRTGPEEEENTVTEWWIQQRSRKEPGGGVSQRIWVLACAALSSVDCDNLTVVVCFCTRDSCLWVTLAAPVGRIYCQVETSVEATSCRILWGERKRPTLELNIGCMWHEACWWSSVYLWPAMLFRVAVVFLWRKYRLAILRLWFKLWRLSIN